jgi:hypothetical protein
MRKLLLAIVCGFFTAGLTAQSIDDVRNIWILGQIKKAKEDLDKGMTNSKFNSKPEAWLLKASIYAALAGDKDMATQADMLLNEATAAFNSYKQKDPELKLLKGEGSFYTNTPGSIYSTYYNNGIAAYNKKDWEGSLKNFKQVVEISDFLIPNKLFNAPLDTNGILLAGASAQNADKQEDAVAFYSRLAQAKVGGEENEFIYPFLVEYYMKKGDNANKDKYVSLGKELYPKSNFWCNIPLIEAGEDTLKIFAAYETMINTNCADFSTYYEYAREMYNYAYIGNKHPEDIPKYEGKIHSALKKSLELKATPEANLLMCRTMFTPINDLIDAYNAVKGTKPEDVKKRNDIGAKLTAKYEEMIPYANAAYDFYDAKANLKPGEKANFKIITNMIVDYWTNKKNKDMVKKYEDRMKAVE